MFTRTKFSKGATAPCVNLIVLAKCKCVETTSRYLLNSFVFEILNYLRHFDVVSVSVTALAFVVALASTAPAVNGAILVKSDAMEVPTTDLSNVYKRQCLH